MSVKIANKIRENESQLSMIALFILANPQKNPGLGSAGPALLFSVNEATFNLITFC